jgi:hypothetical protein
MVAASGWFDAGGFRRETMEEKITRHKPQAKQENRNLAWPC